VSRYGQFASHMAGGETSDEPGSRCCCLVPLVHCLSIRRYSHPLGRPIDSQEGLGSLYIPGTKERCEDLCQGMLGDVTVSNIDPHGIHPIMVMESAGKMQAASRESLSACQTSLRDGSTARGELTHHLPPSLRGFPTSVLIWLPCLNILLGLRGGSSVS